MEAGQDGGETQHTTGRFSPTTTSTNADVPTVSGHQLTERVTADGEKLQHHLVVEESNAPSPPSAGTQEHRCTHTHTGVKRLREAPPSSTTSPVFLISSSFLRFWQNFLKQKIFKKALDKL